MSASKHRVVFKDFKKIILQSNDTSDLQLATPSFISFPLIQLLPWPEAARFSVLNKVQRPHGKGYHLLPAPFRKPLTNSPGAFADSRVLSERKRLPAAGLVQSRRAPLPVLPEQPLSCSHFLLHLPSLSWGELRVTTHSLNYVWPCSVRFWKLKRMIGNFSVLPFSSQDPGKRDWGWEAAARFHFPRRHVPLPAPRLHTTWSDVSLFALTTALIHYSNVTIN